MNRSHHVVVVALCLLAIFACGFCCSVVSFLFTALGGTQ